MKHWISCMVYLLKFHRSLNAAWHFLKSAHTILYMYIHVHTFFLTCNMGRKMCCSMVADLHSFHRIFSTEMCRSFKFTPGYYLARWKNTASCGFNSFKGKMECRDPQQGSLDPTLLSLTSMLSTLFACSPWGHPKTKVAPCRCSLGRSCYTCRFGLSFPAAVWRLPRTETPRIHMHFPGHTPQMLNYPC